MVCHMVSHIFLAEPVMLRHAEAVAEEAELACLVLLDGASQPLPLLLRSSEAADLSPLGILMKHLANDEV